MKLRFLYLFSDRTYSDNWGSMGGKLINSSIFPAFFFCLMIFVAIQIGSYTWLEEGIILSEVKRGS